MELNRLKDEVQYLQLRPKTRYLLLELLLMQNSGHKNNEVYVKTNATILKGRLFPYERQDVVKMALMELEKAGYLRYLEQKSLIILNYSEIIAADLNAEISENSGDDSGDDSGENSGENKPLDNKILNNIDSKYQNKRILLSSENVMNDISANDERGDPKSKSRISDSLQKSLATNPELNELCEYFIEKIKIAIPKQKTPKTGTAIHVNWLYELDLMIRRDLHTKDEIKSVIDWIYRDAFWKTKVLSTPKLREQFAKLHQIMIDEKNVPTKQYLSPEEREKQQKTSDREEEDRKRRKAVEDEKLLMFNRFLKENIIPQQILQRREHVYSLAVSEAWSEYNQKYPDAAADKLTRLRPIADNEYKEIQQRKYQEEQEAVYAS